MKERPILFSTPMVQAILEERKTQIRRILKPQPIQEGERSWKYGKKYNHSATVPPSEDPLFQYGDSPYGSPRNILWVRETHYRYGHWVKNGLTKTGKQKWMFVPDKQFTEIRYFDNPPAKVEKISYRKTGWYKRSSLFMPLSACRIKLEIVDIMVERLQDISEQGALAEGCKQAFKDPGANTPWTAKVAFEILWESINGPESWNENPWVWVIEFKRVPNNDVTPVNQ